MAIVINRPAANHAPNPAHGVGSESRAAGPVGIDVALSLLVALLLGAGAVHLAMAPSHFGESTAEGVGFLVSAWLQILLAIVVVLRPTRRVVIAVVAVTAACIEAWAVSRTVGFPFGAHAGHAESVTIVDGVT